MATIDEATLVNWFTYHPPTEEDLPKFKAIREAALVFARVIVENTEACPDQTVAIRHIRDSVMTANVSIACGGV